MLCCGDRFVCRFGSASSKFRILLKPRVEGWQRKVWRLSPASAAGFIGQFLKELSALRIYESLARRETFSETFVACFAARALLRRDKDQSRGWRPGFTHASPAADPCRLANHPRCRKQAPAANVESSRGRGMNFFVVALPFPCPEYSVRIHT